MHRTEVYAKFSPVARMLETDQCVAAFEMIGSAVYAENPNDVDILVLLKDVSPAEWAGDLPDGWRADGDYADTWLSLKMGGVNLIVTSDDDRFDRSLLASKVCHALELQSRIDRIAVFMVVLDGTADVVELRRQLAAKEERQ